GRAIFRKAFSSSCFPGGILCQGDAPEGCGSGMRSKRCPSKCSTNFFPTTSPSFSNGTNWAIASLPTGITRRGLKISNSSLIHHEQLPTSIELGTRSVPPGDFPGEHRQTAAKYI